MANNETTRFRAEMPSHVEFEIPQDNGAILKFKVDVLDYPCVEKQKL